jgi:hypothetical protein
MASLICDGHHLPPDVVKSLVRGKTPGRCILISDLSGQAGQPPGRYSSPFCDVEILPDGNLVIAGQRELLGGAALPLHIGLANAMRFAGIDLATAVRMAVDHPAALLGIEPGSLAPGSRADLVQFTLTGCPETGIGSRILGVDSPSTTRGRVPVPVSGQPLTAPTADRPGGLDVRCTVIDGDLAYP